MTTPSPQTVPVQRLVVIGLGLIGGSLAKAALQREVCQRVIGIVRRPEICQKAIELGVVHDAFTDLSAITPPLGEGDVVFIAVPTLSVKAVLEDVAKKLAPAVTITDGASVKGSVLANVREIYGCVPEQMVLGHPIAGSEKSGVEAANPELYINHRIILTPTPETGDVHLRRVTGLWQSVGGEVLHLDVKDHDEILAATSHLPHAIAFSLVDTLAHDSNNENIFRYAAGGFRDFTRIASSDAVMWRDIMLANDRAVMQAIDLFSDNLSRLKTAIANHDEQQLLGIFTRAKAARDHFSAMLARRAYVQKDSPQTIDYRFNPIVKVGGISEVPPDKSLSHRAVVLASLAEGLSHIGGFIEGEDAFATLQALRDMGVVIEGPHDGRLVVHGVGLGGLQAPAGPIYVGNASTTLRLLCGLLSTQSFDSEITTGSLLTNTSLESVVKPLRSMGAGLVVSDDFSPPVFIHGARTLKCIEYSVPVASAQVKSALLLAGLYAVGGVRIREPVPTRDHTERLLRAFGCEVHIQDGWIVLPEGQRPQARDIHIPGDFSSALVLVASAGLAEQAHLSVCQVGINPSRTAILGLLKRLGMNISVSHISDDSFEPVGDTLVETSAVLRGVQITSEEAAAAVGELPILLAVAACAEGDTRIEGYRDLALKHHDRLQSMLTALGKLRIDTRIEGNALIVSGGRICGGEVDAGNDHRVALALSVLASRTTSPLTVRNCATVDSAFPGFPAHAKRAGISIEVIDHS